MSSAAQVLERLCFNLETWGLSLAKGLGHSALRLCCKDAESSHLIQQETQS